MATDVESAAMRRAIALAGLGLGTTSPNPPVGCVILDHSGRIAGEGYHQRKGEAHAETHALTAASDAAAGGTAVVTLEPCNHHGRTPPCRQALLDAKVARVVIALIDPTSRGAGGAAVLQSAGIDVEVGVLATEARLVLGTWLTAQETRRPVITWAYRIGVAGPTALPAAGSVTEAIRTAADVIFDQSGIRETAPGAHGPGMIDPSPGHPYRDNPTDLATALYQHGVRSLLLNGDHTLAAPFLAAGLIERLVVHIDEMDTTHHPDPALPWPVLPPGFVLTMVSRSDSGVRAEATHNDL